MATLLRDLRDQLNRMNPAAFHAELGTMIYQLLDRVEELEKAIDGGGEQITSDQISDATVIGKTVLTASDPSIARSAIGAGTSSFSGNYSDLENPPDIPDWNSLEGKPAVIAAGANAQAARQAIGATDLELGDTAETAKPGNWTPSTSDIPDLPANKITSGTFDSERLPQANPTEVGAVMQAAAVADATDETDVVAQLNALLAALRTAGVIQT